MGLRDWCGSCFIAPMGGPFPCPDPHGDVGDSIIPFRWCDNGEFEVIDDGEGEVYIGSVLISTLLDGGDTPDAGEIVVLVLPLGAEVSTTAVVL